MYFLPVEEFLVSQQYSLFSQVLCLLAFYPEPLDAESTIIPYYPHSGAAFRTTESVCSAE